MFGGSRSGKARHGVYTRRRILAVLLVLILLALLVPRACQALMGFNTDTGSKDEQQANAPGADTGTENGAGNGAGNAADTSKSDTSKSDTSKSDTSKSDTSPANTGADKAEESPPDRSGAPFLSNRASNDNGSESSGEPAPDLLALAAPTISAGSGESAGAPRPSETGDETQAGQQQTTEPQNFVIARREAAEQPSSGEESAPRSKKRAAPTAVEPAATSRAERVRERRDLTPSPPVVPAAVDEAGASQITVEPAVADPVTTLPAPAATPVPAAPAATPVPAAPAATPVPAAPAALRNDASFVPSPAGGVATRFGGARRGGAGAIGPASAALQAGPRLATLGPGARAGRAVF
jgi:cytoskeletal protein RodZ